MKKLLAVLSVAGLMAIAAFTSNSTPREPTLVEKAALMALKTDAILDSVSVPEFTSLDLALTWPLEIFPYLEYEGLTGKAWEPMVEFVPLPGAEAMHVAGYTYCEDVVYLNIRYINWVSPWNDEVESLATLVHEIVHTQGGDFCAWDSQTAESRTQLGTLEVLAGMANHENKVALWALLDELRSISMNTVLADAIARNDLDSYRSFRAKIYEDGLSEARFEKSMRFWAPQIGELRTILDKYSVSVFRDIQDGKFIVDLPDTWHLDRTGDGLEDVVVLDDLMYVIENAEEMAATVGEEDE